VKTVPLARIVEERQKTPNLEENEETQFHRFAKIQRTLPNRFAFVSAMGVTESFVIKVDTVEPCFNRAEFGEKVLEMKQKIYSTHPYYAAPSVSPEEHEKRLIEFLASVRSTKPQSKKTFENRADESSPFIS
jgi:hypothetical protein